MELDTDFFGFLNLKNVDISDKLATIRYASFNEFNVGFYVDWAVDPYGVLNWRHNFLSLRWIDFKSDKEKIKLILASFYYFHYLEKKENNMIGARLGDHTTAIRISVLCKLRELFLNNDENNYVFLCEFLVKKDIDTLWSEKVYRKGHNHGVMADTEILNALMALGIEDYLDTNLIVHRGLSSLENLFNQDGVTMEHSISYQEYNYPVALEFLKSAQNFIGNASFNYEVLEKTTVDIIRYFSRSNGEFFPLGDSFREGNKGIRKAFFASQDLSPIINSLKPISQSLFCKNGFFAYIKNQEEMKIHFVSVCSWNSYHHKQDDELSFCLEIDGDLIFDDPGYSDMVSKNDLEMLRSAECHNTITVVGKAYSKRNDQPHGSFFLDWSKYDDGFYLRGQHSRVEDILIDRVYEIRGRRLSITDSIKTQDEISTKHNFILGQGIDFEIKGVKIILNKNGVSVGVLNPDEKSGFWCVSQVIRVDSDRKKINKSIRLQYFLVGKYKCGFDFDF